MSHVPLYLDLLGALLDNHNRFLTKFGNLETKLLTYGIEDYALEKPIFITGMARAGSTVLLETLNAHSQCTAHQYRDYPFLHVPHFWHLLRYLIPNNPKKIERAHKDGLMIGAESPEAMDEILWMSFFKNLHNPEKSNILSAKTQNPAFAKFYREHILKILYTRKAARFVSKNNYDISRLEYLKELFPDALFVIPVRKPEEHIASLVKQNALFRNEQADDPRSQRYTRRLGHHEFGLDFRPINIDNPQIIETILTHWKNEEFTLAYAHYWSALHNYIAENILKNETLAPHIKIIRYDNLCNQPAKTCSELLKFCALPDDKDVKDWANKIKAPQYYKPQFSDKELAQIQEITAPAAAKLWP